MINRRSPQLLRYPTVAGLDSTKSQKTLSFPANLLPGNMGSHIVRELTSAVNLVPSSAEYGFSGFCSLSQARLNR